MSDFNHPDKVNSQDFKNNGNNLNKPLANESRKALAPPLPKIVNFEKQMAGFAQKGGKRKKNFFVFKIFLSLFFFLIMIIVGFYYFTDVSKQITEDDLTKIDRSNIALDPDISILSEWGKCNSATDCVVVQKDCCTCEQGGIQQALNLNFEIKWQDIIKNKCSDVVCQGDNNCQSGEVICDNNICKFKQIEKKEGEIEDEDKKIWTEYEDASGLFKFFFPPGFKNFFIKESGIILFNSVALNGQIKIEVAANDKKLGAQELLAEFKRNDTSGMVFQEILAEVNGYQYYRLGQYERGLLERYFFPIDDKIVIIDFSFSSQAFSTEYSPAKDMVLIQDIIKTFEFIKPTESTSANVALIRDEKRLADIEKIRMSLEKYFQDINKYPLDLFWGESLSRGGEIVYLSVLPKDPDPEKFYKYRSLNGLVYALVFELEIGNDEFGPGEYIATPDKLEKASDIDNDGLYDLEEELYGTDKNKADSDNDGYDDLSEFTNGYNPVGPGMIKLDQ